jgi:hypothetical protein
MTRFRNLKLSTSPQGEFSPQHLRKSYKVDINLTSSPSSLDRRVANLVGLLLAAMNFKAKINTELANAACFNILLFT